MPEPEGSIYFEDANGTLYLAVPAGVFDVPDRATVAYEDEERPDGARPLYTITAVEA